MLAIASIAHVNFVKGAVAAVVVMLAVGYVASDAEIDSFHSITSVKLLCAESLQIMRGY